MQTGEKTSLQIGTKRTFGKRATTIGGATLRLILGGISARAHAVAGTAASPSPLARTPR